MGQQVFSTILITIIFMVFIAGAHVFKDYKNKAVVLTSVYDAMKSNLQQDIRNNLNRNDVLHDSRNKRNTNEKVEYYDVEPSESNNEWAVVNSPGYPSSDLVCTRRGDTQTRVTVTDHHPSGLTIALIIKYGLLVLAAFTLPIIIFKLFIIPFKILLGLKAISLLNSVLLGSILYKYKFSKYRPPLGGYPGQFPAGIGPGAASSSSSSSAASSAASANSFEANLSDDVSDYVDVVRPNEDLKRILNYVKKRNKNW